MGMAETVVISDSDYSDEVEVVLKPNKKRRVEPETENTNTVLDEVLEVVLKPNPNKD